RGGGEAAGRGAPAVGGPGPAGAAPALVRPGGAPPPSGRGPPATPTAPSSAAPSTHAAPAQPTTPRSGPAPGGCPANYIPPDPRRPTVTLRFTVGADLGTVQGSEHIEFTPDLPITELVFRLTANTAP